jgi:Cd2+/Zn2+-exporting ATPase
MPPMDVFVSSPSISPTNAVSKKPLLFARMKQLSFASITAPISLGQVRLLAEEAGATVTDRYRHEHLPFAGLDTADAAWTLEQSLSKLPGALHAHVNYAAGLIFIGYDSTLLNRARIEQTIKHQGARIITTPKASHPEHDNSAPDFLPRWIQDQWALILVVLCGIFFLVGWVGETFLGLPEWTAITLFILASMAGGYDIATHALPGLLKGKFDTDFLMLAAAGGAAILGEWAEGAFLLFLFSVGHAGEHYALDRARNAVNALGALMPKTAQVKRGDTLVEESVEYLQIGDVVVVRPGDRIPVDGTVKNGSSAVDQSPITGESMPIIKYAHDTVFAGTINQDAALEVEVTRLAQDNTLSRVMRLVAEAQEQRSPTQQVTERFTRWFVPVVLIGTLLFIFVPPLMGWLSFEKSFYRGMLLLVAASPCALAIGTPAVVLAGIAQAARKGVLIKGGVHLENLGSLNAIAFDKTGTITEGEFRVRDVIPCGTISPQELLQVAASIEQQSNHPLAQAIVRAAQEQNISLLSANSLENVPGRGVRSQLDNHIILVGSLKLLSEATIPIEEAIRQAVTRLEAQGQTTVVIGRDKTILGVLGLADAARSSAPAVMAQLRALGVQHLVMLTGDNSDVARRIAHDVGLTDIRAELLPEDKLQAIKTLEAQYHSIAMLGDGVNDAPALATATVGIAMGGAGTAVALETADVALMGDDLTALPFAVGLSRFSRRIIWQNLAIALGVIVLLIFTSVLAIVPLSGAVLLHEGSTVMVVLNALRLLVFKD